MIIQTSDACTEGLAGTQWRHHKQPRKRLHSTAQRRSPGWDSLAVAVIEQAITDYFVLRNYGAVKWGKKIDDANRPKRKYRGYNYYATHYYGIDVTEIDNLLYFLQGGVQHFADLCELNAGGWNNLMGAIIRRERAGKQYTRQISTIQNECDENEEVNYAIT